ncbi:hypothetical protein F0562_030667 [Nyssa sinensis]|uniref:Protein kinase domain-containing protein n=1 Tax=Nyssa sinensis TaxID=561372 RepID=A0A5J5AYZ2_9ASTE|nr:hypothetical protein F0562_030667 [Nyssa sinensis]
MILAVVAVVIAIIDCLNNAGSAIPEYAPNATGHAYKALQPSPTQDSIIVAVPPVYPVIPDSQVEGAAMEIFLSNMASEKPIRFSREQIEGFTRSRSNILGEGGFGIVYKGEFPDGVQVAVKVLKNNPDKRMEEQFMAEVSTMGRTYHINLVRLYGFCFESTTRALVYEYMENGSLDAFLFGQKRVIEWEKLHEIAIGVAKGIAYLHEECQKRIIHYDIKPGNVLLDANLKPKVADFGLAKLCNRESSHVLITGYKGTRAYSAPEMWKPYPVTHKCDVYSFGVLLFEILTRRRSRDTNVSETQQWLPRWVWEKFENNELEEMLSVCRIEEKDREKATRTFMVALWCIQYLPEARPATSTVVRMLEGGMEITPPPYPFQHLESPANPGMVDGTKELVVSTSTTKTSQPSYSKPKQGTPMREAAGEAEKES